MGCLLLSSVPIVKSQRTTREKISDKICRDAIQTVLNHVLCKVDNWENKHDLRVVVLHEICCSLQILIFRQVCTTYNSNETRTSTRKSILKYHYFSYVYVDLEIKLFMFLSSALYQIKRALSPNISDDFLLLRKSFGILDTTVLCSLSNGT